MNEPVVRARIAAIESLAAVPDDAIGALHELSQGSLRKIDRLATASLREASRRRKKLVDKDVVSRVAEALVRFD